MGGHEIWMSECKKMHYVAEPRRYEEGTRTSEDAANQLGCNISHIAKSIVYGRKVRNHCDYFGI
jgi:prolyl-tRNA editing enzyme YbaK/EbsC (Cys-tRNA(Pro) deacylase)